MRERLLSAHASVCDSVHARKRGCERCGSTSCWWARDRLRRAARATYNTQRATIRRAMRNGRRGMRHGMRHGSIHAVCRSHWQVTDFEEYFQAHSDVFGGVTRLGRTWVCAMPHTLTTARARTLMFTRAETRWSRAHRRAHRRALVLALTQVRACKRTRTYARTLPITGAHQRTHPRARTHALSGMSSAAPLRDAALPRLCGCPWHPWQ